MCHSIVFDWFSLSRLQGKSQLVEQELARLGEQRVQTSEGTRAIALELCREFEDTFLQHINTGEVCIELVLFALVIYKYCSIFVLQKTSGRVGPLFIVELYHFAEEMMQS